MLGLEAGRAAYLTAQNALQVTGKAGILGTIGALTIQLGVSLGILSASLATNAALTFGVGVAIAVAAAAAGYAMIKSLTAVGDLKIDPNGGPIVSSPKEGGIFQGTKNDELRMGPSQALDAAAKSRGSAPVIVQQNTTPTTTTPQNNEQVDKTNSLLEELLNFQVKQPQLSSVGLYEVQ